MPLPLKPPIKPQLARSATELPTGDGYAGTVVPDLTLVLRRTSVRERVVVERIPIFP